MAIQPIQDRSNVPDTDEFSLIGPDAMSTFERIDLSLHSITDSGSEEVYAAPRTPSLDEEDEVEDDEDDEDLEDDEEDEDDEDEAPVKKKK